MKKRKLFLIIFLLSALYATTTPAQTDHIFANGFEASVPHNNRAILGNLKNAQINAYRLDDLSNSIETKTTSSANDLHSGGGFEVQLTGIPDDEWILLTATGGYDLDADDNGVLDATPSQNFGTIHALAKASEWRAGNKHITALTDISWRYTKNLLGQIQPSELFIRYDELAKQFIQTDLNADGVINYLDVLAFIPNDQSQRANLNFNYQVLLDLDANNQSYIAATHANQTKIVEQILDQLFAHTLTRHVVPDQRYSTIVIDVAVFGEGTISSNKTTLASSKNSKISNKLYLNSGSSPTTLTATPAAGYFVYSWDGCDTVSADRLRCTVNTNYSRNVVANFATDNVTLANTAGNSNVKVLDLSQANIIEGTIQNGLIPLDVTINSGLPHLLADMQTLNVDDIVAGTTAVSSGGFIRRVASITQNASNPLNYTLQTEDVPLAQIIEQGTGILNHQLTNGQLIDYTPASSTKQATVSPQAFSGMDGVKLIPAATADDPTFTLQFGGEDKSSVSSSLVLYSYQGAELSVNGSVDFEIDLDAGFNYKVFSGLQDFRFVSKIITTKNLHYTVTGALPGFAKQKKIGTLNFTKIKFSIGLVPVWITPKVDFFIGAKGKVETSLSAGVELVETATAGLRYNKNIGFSAVRGFEKNEKPLLPSLSANASIKVYLKAEPSMKIYSVTGPKISLEAYLKLASAAVMGGDAWLNDNCINGLKIALSTGVWGGFTWDLSGDTKIGRMLHLDQLQLLTKFEIFSAGKVLKDWEIGGTCTAEPPFMLVDGSPLIFSMPYSTTPQTRSTTVNLTNQGDTALNWQASYQTDTILQVTPSSGSLNAGQSTSVQLDLQTGNLPTGKYHNPVLFTNLFDPTLPNSESGTQSVAVSADVRPVDNSNPPTITALNSTNAGLVNIQWSFNPSASALPLNRYHIYSTTTPADPNSWQLRKVVIIGTNSQTLSGFAGGQTVSFYIVARGNGGITTPDSQVMSVTIAGNVPLPASGNLNDTGITWGGDYPSGNNSSCTGNMAAPQDCDHGRDATHNDDSDGHAGFSFTKLDSNGNPLPPSASTWSCVRDNVTGLVWEVKTNDGGIHDKYNTYRWGGITRQGNYGTNFYNDWDSLVNGSNTENLCGYNDWRVPTRQELLSIVNYGRLNPAIDPNFFPNAHNSTYWSASPYSRGASHAWYVAFDDGIFGYVRARSGYDRVRLVRFGQ